MSPENPPEPFPLSMPLPATVVMSPAAGQAVPLITVQGATAHWDHEADVGVVGAGATGLPAAIEAGLAAMLTVGVAVDVLLKWAPPHPVNTRRSGNMNTNAKGEEFTLSGIRPVMLAHATDPLSAIFQSIVDAVHRHGHAADDQSMLLVRCHRAA